MVQKQQDKRGEINSMCMRSVWSGQQGAGNPGPAQDQVALVSVMSGALWRSRVQTVGVSEATPNVWASGKKDCAFSATRDPK